MNRKCIELIRVSTKRQAEAGKESIPTQKEINRRTAKTFGLEIVRSIEITDVSGAMILTSPEMQELLRLIQSPDIHGVVSYAFNRIMRPENFADFAILQAFLDTKTSLYLPDGLIDLTSKNGRILGVFKATMAGEERIDFLQRMWDVKEEIRRAGQVPQSHITIPDDVICGEHGWRYKPEVEKIRKAFQLLLSGNLTFASIARKVGLHPRTLAVKLQNPIYTGWRVIDQRRDPSPAAHRVKPDGRQADRPKIKRKPEEVIRVRVIQEGIISEEEFQRAQLLIETKRRRHWRAQPHHHRYTYNGFLVCSQCGEPIYTKVGYTDYYACKGRVRQKSCHTIYMRRDALDSKLDRLFSVRLTDEDFLSGLLEQIEQRSSQNDSPQRIERLTSGIQGLEQKRTRVMDAYFEGDISTVDRKDRVAKIDREIETMRDLLFKETPLPSLSLDTVSKAFASFCEFEYLERDDKRQLLSALAPEIRVADYHLESISYSDNAILSGKGSIIALPKVYLPIGLDLRFPF